MTEGKQTLDELLSDPIVKLVMARDKVRPEEVRMLLERVRDRAVDEPVLLPPHMIRTCKAQWMNT